jgi:hypothetical protein
LRGFAPKRLGDLVTYVPQAPRPRAYEVATKVEPAFDRVVALATVLPYLDPEHRMTTLAEAREQARLIPDEVQQALALAKLGLYLSETERRVLIHNGLLAAQKARNDYDREELLAEVIPLIAVTVCLQAAVKQLRTLSSQGSRLDALMTIADRLPVPMLDEELNLAVSTGGADVVVRAIKSLAPLLPAPQLNGALSRIRGLPKKQGIAYPRVEALLAVAPHLPEEEQRPVIREALDEVKENLTSRYGSARHELDWLAQRGVSAKFAEMGYINEFMNCLDVRNNNERSRAQSHLIAYLPRNERKKILETFLDHVQRSNDDNAQRAVQATYLMAMGRVDEARQATPAVTAYAERAAIAHAITQFGYSEEALTLIATLPDISIGPSIAVSLVAVAPALSERCLPNALQIARGVWDRLPRCNALLALGTRLNPTMKVALIQEVVEIVRGIEKTVDRAKALASLSSDLNEILLRVESERCLIAPLLEEALGTVRALDDVESRAEQLVSLSRLATADERDTILQEVVGLGSSSENDSKILVAAIPVLVDYVQASYPKQIVSVAADARWRLSNDQVAVIGKLSSQISDPLLRPIFATADSWVNERGWALALASLSRWLAKGGHPQEALAFARAIRYQLFEIRLLALTWALPAVSETDRIAIVNEMILWSDGMEDSDWGFRPGNRRKLLSVIASHLAVIPDPQRYDIWCDILKKISFQTRQQSLKDLCVFPKVIQSLAGDEALVQTIGVIRDVGRWFP